MQAPKIMEHQKIGTILVKLLELECSERAFAV